MNRDSLIRVSLGESSWRVWTCNLSGCSLMFLIWIGFWTPMPGYLMWFYTVVELGLVQGWESVTCNGAKTVMSSRSEPENSRTQVSTRQVVSDMALRCTWPWVILVEITWGYMWKPCLVILHRRDDGAHEDRACVISLGPLSFMLIFPLPQVLTAN